MYPFSVFPYPDRLFLQFSTPPYPPRIFYDIVQKKNTVSQYLYHRQILSHRRDRTLRMPVTNQCRPHLFSYRSCSSFTIDIYTGKNIITAHDRRISDVDHIRSDIRPLVQLQFTVNIDTCLRAESFVCKDLAPCFPSGCRRVHCKQ